MAQIKQCEPFIIQTVLLPTADSSFIHKLILAYSQKLSLQNPQFQIQFQEKQDKLSRHNDQLKLLREMKQDQFLREQVLQQIELKDYEKEYQSLFGSDQINQHYQRPLSYKLRPSSKQNRSFHMTSQEQKSKENLNQNSQQQQKNILGYEQPSKKFRSSLIKSGSFSSIKKKSKIFCDQTNIHKSLRNSSDGFGYQRNTKIGAILKKKGVGSLVQEANECEKSFVRSKDIVKNSIMQNSEEQEQEKQTSFQATQMEMANYEEGKYIKQKEKNQEQDKGTQRTHLKTPSSKLPQVYCSKEMTTPGKQKRKNIQNQSTGKSSNKYYLKDNKQNPYHISHFLRQISSYQYVSQYNQVKNQTKRSNEKKE